MDRTHRSQKKVSHEDEPVLRPGVAVIGVGAVGSSLARSLHRAGYRVVALINRSRQAAETMAREIGVPIASSDVSDVPPEARLLFICTRDDVISVVVDALLRTEIHWPESVVAHVSGRQPASVLDRLAVRGAKTLSFHPLGSFPPNSSGKTLRGLTIGLEGDPVAVAVGRTVAQDIDARPVEIPSGAKEAYHLAAAMTSNFLVTLLDDVERILLQVGLPADLTHSLAVDTLGNLHGATSEEALTGPIARGDLAGLAKQIATLTDLAPELLPRFIVLANATVDLAVRAGRISSDERVELRHVLEVERKR